MQIAVASGKGGTGKTLLATCLIKAWSDDKAALIDADVEEPNAALAFMQPVLETSVINRMIPEIDPESCVQCGMCAVICRFNALVVLENNVLVFSELCHSCGACSTLCQYAAIREKEHPIGVIEETGLPAYGTLITGRLNVGEAQSPPLIRETKIENLMFTEDC
jgi:MinD superfamily P-loop ATPase